MTIVESSSKVWKPSWAVRPALSLSLLAVALAAGCGGVPKTYLYTLQVPAAPAPADPKTTYVLGVEHFHSPEVLRDDRVMYYTSATEMNFYQYHRWGAEPAELVSDFAAQWLESSGVFAQVKMLPDRQHVDYMLAGSLDSFEEVDAQGSPKVRLAVTMSLMRTNDHKVVWTGAQRLESPVQERGVEGVASAMNSTVAQAMRQMVPGLLAQVEQDFQTHGK